MKIKVNSVKKFVICLVICLLVSPGVTFAGNKRIMSINAAKVVAERALVESIYGLKIRASESVEDMVAANFQGSAETKTQAQLRGVIFEETVYDEAQDLAKVTASVSLPSITNINGETVDLQGKVFRRVGFATSTPSLSGAIKALRAAEIDAYKQLAKTLVGFTLESETKVENYILTSDVIRTKVMSTLFMAQVTEYGWHNSGDAYVKMTLNPSDVGDVLGQQLANATGVIEVEGLGAQEDDFSKSKKKK